MPNLRITIDVNTDDDAFQPDATAGMRRVFSDVETAVFHSEKFGRGLDAESILFDESGNRCGRVRLEYETPKPAAEPCAECDGTGTVEISIGGDGYGGRCAASADVEADCIFCDGTGRVETGGTS